MFFAEAEGEALDVVEGLGGYGGAPLFLIRGGRWRDGPIGKREGKRTNGTEVGKVPYMFDVNFLDLFNRFGQ